MRKITSILSMFLLIAGWNTASAQFAFKKLKTVGDRVTQLSQLVDGHYYVFKSNDKNKFIKLDKETMQFKNEEYLTEGDNSDGLAVFKLHVDASTGTNLYSFESARGGYYMPKVEKNAPANATNATSPAQFVIKTTDKNNGTRDNCWAIKNSADDYYFDMQNDKFVGWDGSGDNTWYEIYDVTVSDVETDLQIVYKVVYSGENASTTYDIATTRTQCPVPNTSYYFSVTQPSDLTITETNNSFEFNITKGETPFTAGQWYSLRIDHKGSRILRAVTEDDSWFVNTEPGKELKDIVNNYPNFLNALWRIEESGYGVKIYNKRTGKYLKTNGDGEDKTKRVSFDNTGTVFYVKKNGTGLAFYTGSKKGYLNACCKSAGDGTENRRLGVWNNDASSEDPGSRLLLELSENELLTYGKKAFAATTDGNFYTNDNALKKGGNYWKYKSSVDAANKLNELFNATDNVNPVGAYPETGVYYLIRNVREGAIGTGEDKNKYLSSEYVFCDTEGKIQEQVGTVSNDRKIKRTKGTSALLPRLWKFEKTADGKYNLLNANTHSYVYVASMLTKDNQSQKDAYEIYTTESTFGGGYNATNDNTTMFVISSSKAAGNKLLNADGGYQYGTEEGVGTWSGNEDAGNYWQFIKVTEVPLNIAANDYITLCLPFNVKLPEGSAVKAYYASAAAGKVLKLTEITGIIPANEGVILQNTGAAEATINLTITTDEATTLTDNRLVGVTAKREGYAVKSNYVLADGNKGIGFYKANFTAIPANKAYLPSENITNAQGVMMAFSFGDEVTGIDNVNAAAPAAKKYYDLQGRRVLYPAKGIFVTEDGQKVLFK